MNHAARPTDDQAGVLSLEAGAIPLLRLLREGDGGLITGRIDPVVVRQFGAGDFRQGVAHAIRRRVIAVVISTPSPASSANPITKGPRNCGTLKIRSMAGRSAPLTHRATWA